MSYSFKGETCIIIHEGDFTGDVQIIGMVGQSVVVSCEDLLAFVAEFRRRKLINKLEGMSWQNILK